MLAKCLRNACREATSIERRLTCCFEETARRLEDFAKLNAQQRPDTAQVAAYQRAVEQADVVTLGEHWTMAFLRKWPGALKVMRSMSLALNRLRRPGSVCFAP